MLALLAIHRVESWNANTFQSYQQITNGLARLTVTNPVRLIEKGTYELDGARQLVCQVGGWECLQPSQNILHFSAPGLKEHRDPAFARRAAFSFTEIVSFALSPNVLQRTSALRFLNDVTDRLVELVETIAKQTAKSQIIWDGKSQIV